MKPPKTYKRSNRLEMPRDNIKNVPIYRALNKGSELFRASGFDAHIDPRIEYGNKTRRLYISGVNDCARLQWMELH